MTMTTTTLEPTADFGSLLDTLRAAIEGDLTSRSRVVDGLLDLRNATHEPLVLTLVDETLVSIPGVNTVPNRWWIDRLDALRDLHSPT